MPGDLQSRAKEFEADLRRFFPKSIEPDILGEAMGYSLFASSKRVRPVLLLETCTLLDGRREDALPLAVGIEMIHTYSLIHDDLPMMDDDDRRRGVPSNHVKYGSDFALLAGDGLLSLAFEVMLEGASRTTRKAKYLRALQYIAEASGVRGMVAGKCMDLLAEEKDPNGAMLDFIHSRKTAALMGAAVTAGAQVAGAGRSDMRILARVGSNLGMMFQIVDDLLDEVGDPALTGRNAGSDERKQKMTYNRVYGVPAARKKVRQLRDGIQEDMMRFGLKSKFFLELTDFLSTRTF